MKGIPAASVVLVSLFLGAARPALAQPAEIPLWNGAPSGSESRSDPEVVQRSTSGERSVWNVHRPSLTPYLPPADKANGAAVIVIPGGGHRVLAIEHEGYNVGQWLADRGIAAFVLKYRLARETNSTYRIDVHALADTERAVRMVRSRAVEWHIHKAHVGVLGFSAGGELAALVSSRGEPGDASASDPLARESSRPDFQALIYPGRSGDIQPRTNAPPAFLACGFGDRPDISEGLAEVYLRFKRAGVPTELHIYSGAGHGFGLRSSNRSPAGDWATRLTEWMQDRGYLRP